MDIYPIIFQVMNFQNIGILENILSDSYCCYRLRQATICEPSIFYTFLESIKYFGHKASTILKYLKIAIEQLKKDGYTSSIPAGMDGWSINLNVFMNHLRHMKESIENLIEKHPIHKNVRYIIDSASGENKEEYPDVISD
jgi:hypothetical protein